MSEERALLLEEALRLWPDLCREVESRHEAEEAATRASRTAIERASAAHAETTEALTVARDLATALQGGAGSSNPPTLAAAVQAARALLEGTEPP